MLKVFNNIIKVFVISIFGATTPKQIVSNIKSYSIDNLNLYNYMNGWLSLIKYSHK